MPTNSAHQGPRTVHLFPKPEGWILMSLESGEQGQLFPDLGKALDAATSSLAQVHVVVHDRTAVIQANAG